MAMSGKITKIAIGSRFGQWTVLSFSHISSNKAKSAYWKCVCDCGNEGFVAGSVLRKGKSKKYKSCANKINGKKGHVSRKHLYMIKCGPFVKIGSTDDIKTRLVSISSYNPYPTELVGYWKNYGHKEKEWHDALGHLHHKGEWFKLGGSCEI